MEVHVYSCPFRTGLIYCDIRAKGERSRSVHANTFHAYLAFSHLDEPGVDIKIDVPGESLKKLREKYENQSYLIGQSQ